MEELFLDDDKYPEARDSNELTIAYWSIRGNFGDRSSDYVTPAMGRTDIIQFLELAMQLSRSQSTRLVKEMEELGFLTT